MNELSPQFYNEVDIWLLTMVRQLPCLPLPADAYDTGTQITIIIIITDQYLNSSSLTSNKVV